MKQTNFRILLICFLCGIGLETFGQVTDDYIIDVQHFTVEDGLSDRRTKCVFQDSKGFIWVGTSYGLNRYDGHEWKVFTQKDGLTDNEIHKIMEDDQGWIWIYFRTKLGLPSFIHTETLEVLSFEERFPDLHFDASNVGSIGAYADTRKIYVHHPNTIEVFQHGQWQTIPANGIKKASINQVFIFPIHMSFHIWIISK